MKIKITELGFEQMQNLKPKKLKAPKKPNIFFRTLLKIVSLPDLLFLKKKINRIGMEKLSKKEPCLILMNHSSFIDLEIASSIFYPRPISIVTTQDGFVGKNWLMRDLGCIHTVKFATDIKLVKEMINAVQNLKTSVLMYPEAGYSFDGTSTTLPDILGRCAKMLKVPVVMVTAYGAYHRQPLYNNLIKRKVPLEINIEYLFSKKDVERLTEDELNRRIKEKFTFDNFKWQKDNNIIIDHPKRAEGINRLLYKCPHCLNEGEMISKDHTLTCQKCNKIYELSPLGEMIARDGESEFKHIPDWYKWERKEVKKEILEGKYLVNLDIDIYMMIDTYKIYHLGDGTLKHDINGFVLKAYDDKLSFELPGKSSYTVNADYFWYELGDIICIGDLKHQYYCFPKTNKDIVTKLRLAAEEIYKIHNNK